MLPCSPFGFRHREQVNGWDSICLNCFRTVATTATEELLRPAEMEHLCCVEDVLPHRSEPQPIPFN